MQSVSKTAIFLCELCEFAHLGKSEPLTVTAGLVLQWPSPLAALRAGREKSLGVVLGSAAAHGHGGSSPRRNVGSLNAGVPAGVAGNVFVWLLAATVGWKLPRTAMV